MGSLPITINNTDNDNSRRPHSAPRLPAGAWDSHVHVVDEDAFPLHPEHPYRPRRATPDDLRAFHEAHGLARACLVAFSIYHTDNRCLVDGLRRLNNNSNSSNDKEGQQQQGVAQAQQAQQARGVACIDPYSVAEGELRELHAAGVRAVRLNMRTRGDVFDAELLVAAARRVAPLGWAVQVYISLGQVVELAAAVPRLGGVPVVVDHLGAPDGGGGGVAVVVPGRQQRGYAELLSLLRSGAAWTKLSGAYRFEALPDLDDYVVEVLRAAPDRVVWASDWPHSGGVERNPGGDRTRVQEYRAVDDRAWIDRCLRWCAVAEGDGDGGGDGGVLARKIWVDNPRKLWQCDS